MNGMKGFIELTVFYDGMKLLLPLQGIRSITELEDGRALVETESLCCCSPKEKFSLFDTKETYREVKQKILSEV